LQYLVRASGFQNVSVRYSAPYPNESKLQRIAAEDAETPVQAAMATIVNDNVTKLNSLLFTHLDYAAIGERM
jgi:hypothetical protein